MSSLEPRNESDLVAVKAGINVKYPEKSEYATSFGFTQPLAYKKTTVLAINPTQDVLSATGGRPLIKKIDYDPKTAISQTKNDHQWPKLEKRELFEWIK
ncbi:unnamed protein product [Brachionus calyciflorus]|uniref:Uncharacterized protein n=1 Tax=Brachionus calyciflorus TaxID=104777 RepID=A0A813VIJ9_9BILA|nr:unnamed protein product [Brachionus calyciflorus]